MSIIQGLIAGVSNTTKIEIDKPDPGTGDYATTYTGVGSQGTPYDPGYATDTVYNSVSGLWRRHFLGNWNSGSTIGDINFFNTHSAVGALADTYVSFGNRNLPDQSNYAFEWLGYIQAPGNGTFNFALDADDYAKMWIGSTAISGYNENNNIFTSIANSIEYNHDSVQLTAGKWYPVRIWFQEITGGERMQLYAGLTGETMTSMSQWNMAYNSSTSGFNPPTYNLAAAGNVTSVNEGTALTFNVTTTNFGTGTLYWTTGSTGSYAIDAGRFSPGATGSVAITDDTGSFTVTVSADTFTATGSQIYNIVLATSLSPPTTVGNTVSITVGDTSQTPLTHGSALFDGSSYYRVGSDITAPTTADSGNAGGLPNPPSPDGSGSYTRIDLATYSGITPGMTFDYDNITFTVAQVIPQANHFYDYLGFVSFYPQYNGVIPAGTSLTFKQAQPWNLGTTWTVEFWSKARIASTGSIFTIACQTPSTTSVDMFYVDGKLRVANDGFDVCNEPTPGVWTHVAVVSNSGTVTVYYNGVQQYSGFRNINLTDSSRYLIIGKRGEGNYQYFDGKLTNMRITNTAVYTSTFLPTVLPEKISGTKFLWTPNNYGISTDDSDLALPVTNYGATYNSDYPVEAAYEANVIGGGILNAVRYVNGQSIDVAATNFDGTPAAGSYIAVNGTVIASDSSIGTGYPMTRGHTLAVINQFTGATISVQSYDTYGSAPDRTALASALAGVTAGRIIAISTYDATMIDGTTRTNLQNYYGSTTSATWAPSRRSHLFIGVKR